MTLNISSNQIEGNGVILNGKQKEDFLLVKILRVGVGVKMRTFFVVLTPITLQCEFTTSFLGYVGLFYKH